MADRLRPRLRAGVLVAALALAASGCAGATAEPRSAGGSSSADPDAAFEAAITHQPYTVDGAPLTDTDGRPFSLVADTDKPVTLVFFGYTHCPEICGLVLSQLASGLTRLDDAERDQVDVVFVTSDPARDTGPVLRRYLDRFDPTFIGLTGELATISAVGEPLAVYVDDGEKLPSGGYDLNSHSSQVTAITADDTAPLLWTQDTSSGQYAADIHTLLQQQEGAS